MIQKSFNDDILGVFYKNQTINKKKMISLQNEK